VALLVIPCEQILPLEIIRDSQVKRTFLLFGGQTVIMEDALSLAEALAKALFLLFEIRTRN
jgi:hypothetical protein